VRSVDAGHGAAGSSRSPQQCNGPAIYRIREVGSYSPAFYAQGCKTVGVGRVSFANTRTQSRPPTRPWVTLTGSSRWPSSCFIGTRLHQTAENVIHKCGDSARRRYILGRMVEIRENSYSPRLYRCSAVNATMLRQHATHGAVPTGPATRHRRTSVRTSKSSTESKGSNGRASASQDVSQLVKYAEPRAEQGLPSSYGEERFEARSGVSGFVMHRIGSPCKLDTGTTLSSCNDGQFHTGRIAQ
jgi:hypothetical protein